MSSARDAAGIAALLAPIAKVLAEWLAGERREPSAELRALARVPGISQSRLARLRADARAAKLRRALVRR